MPAHRFARLEARLSNAVMTTFANLALLDAENNAIDAVLDDAEADFGEFDLTHEKRQTLTFKNVNALKKNAVLTVSSTQYTTAEISAMPKTEFVLDKLEKDDGHLQTWWVR